MSEIGRKSLFRTGMIHALLCVPLICFTFAFLISLGVAEPASNSGISSSTGQMDKLYPGGSNIAFVPTGRESIINADGLRIVSDPRALAFKLMLALSLSAALIAITLFGRLNPGKQREKRIPILAISGGGHAPPNYRLN